MEGDVQMAEQPQAQRIQFNDGIEAMHPNRSNVEKQLPDESSSSEKRADIDDEERARRIAENDLHGSRKQTYSGFLLLWLAFQSTGVIYGDIGTSPLYVFSSTFTAQPSYNDLLGALSLIIWSLTLIVSVKYCLIVLCADDDGQGGTFALYSLVARYTNITSDQGQATPRTVHMKRYLTGDLKAGGKSIRSFIESSTVCKFGLKLIGVLGVSMIMADGVLTPAQSVLGAIQGIKVANPNLGTSPIVGSTCAILIFLFFLQPFGTSKLGTTFAPIIAIWLLFNMVSGIYNLVYFDHTVLKAFSPYFAFDFLIRNGSNGWRSLGGILLSFTGVEALFADLGAFSKRAIQISWFGFVYPCLLLAYIGQAAFISVDPTQMAWSNPVFYTIPPGTLYFSLVIATLAAIVASQATITATFQLLMQVMRLSYFPHIKVVHTSPRFHEQVYMPMANWLLMIGTVVVTAVYNNTTSLGNAYGLCVISVTFITTCMTTLVAILVWRLPIYIVIPVFLIFGALDGAFLSSVITKVPQGAWFTLLLALILSSIFILWRFGKEAQWNSKSVDHIPTSAVITSPRTLDDSQNAYKPVYLTDAFGGIKISTVPGLGIFFDKAGNMAYLPASFAHFVRKLAARPAALVFFHMRPLPVPSIPLAERYIVTRISSLANCYYVVLRHGYMDDVLHPGIARDLVNQIELALSRASETSAGREVASAAELAALHAASESQIVYVLGKEVMKIRPRTTGMGVVGHFFRRGLLEAFLWIRENSRTKLANLDIDADKLIEVGFVKEI